MYRIRMMQQARLKAKPSRLMMVYDLLLKRKRNNKKDNSTRRGLLAMVALRKRLLAYLERENVERYLSLTTELGIRRAAK